MANAGWCRFQASFLPGEIIISDEIRAAKPVFERCSEVALRLYKKAKNNPQTHFLPYLWEKTNSI